MSPIRRLGPVVIVVAAAFLNSCGDRAAGGRVDIDENVAGRGGADGAGGTGGGGGTDCSGAGSCVPLACTSNDDCTRPAVCDSASGECVTYERCDQYVCWAEGGACGHVGDRPVCIDASCGAPLNACTACTQGPDGGAGTEDAPVIYGARRVSDCAPFPDFCGEGAVMCRFAVTAYHPNNSYGYRGFVSLFVVLTGNDEPIEPTIELDDFGSSASIEWSMCLDSRGRIADMAVYLEHNSGARSQTLCVADPP